MILPVHQTLRSRLIAALGALYGIGADDPVVRGMAIESPPNRALGDLAVAVAFELARRLRKAPRIIAQEIAGALGTIEGVVRIEATPSGYINFHLDRRTCMLAWLGDAAATSGAGTTSDAKVIVEHTAINPNKAAHIGHLRNAALGDMFVRLLRFQGLPVEVQNYIDDTGVQVADVVVGFRELERKGFDDIRKIADSTRFDYYCWDLYARVTEWYEADKSRLKIRAAALHDIEHGGNEPARIAQFVADRIVRLHLQTMRRMNVEYDLLTWEGDILRLQFWAHAFERLKQQGAVFLQTEGRLAGCWVMRIEEDPLLPGQGTAEPAAEDDEDEQREKVIVRSDGTVTYVGKDIAYQLWKFGLLGRDFQYRVYERRNGGRPLWATSAEPSRESMPPPRFGRASATYNVIDTRQAYLQKLLKQALVAIGYPREAERSHHFSYEMVALSHRTARELGYQAADQSGRPFVEVSGRKGLGVKADDLLDRLTEKATAEVARRNPEFSSDECRQIASAIATAAVRYFMVKYSRGKIIAFDIDEALSFEGESGPYLQYAVVRANNIFHKLREREGLQEQAILGSLASLPPDVLMPGPEGDDLWGLVLEAARLDELVEQSVRTLELSVLAKYAFGLAQAFNAFYHRYPILNEERPDARRWRAAAVSFFRAQMTRALELMGCTVPPRM